MFDRPAFSSMSSSFSCPCGDTYDVRDRSEVADMIPPVAGKPFSCCKMLNMLSWTAIDISFFFIVAESKLNLL